jgi:hypothetical protein
MRILYKLFLLLLSISTYCQETSVITDFGDENGEKSEGTIGKDGGRLISADGKLELIIPPGSINKSTTFRIQPVKNMLVLGLGSAYKLYPSGIKFKIPVQLKFQYDADEADGEMQSVMGIAMQDEKGKWFELNQVNIDTTSKQISGNVFHFSVWTKFMALRISPRTARLKVGSGKNMVLEIHMLKQDFQVPEPNSSITNLQEIRLAGSSVTGGIKETVFIEGTKTETDPSESFLKKWNAEWTVNGITNGNENYGRITPAFSDRALYTTPSTVPEDNNPVTVTIKLTGLNYKMKGKNLNNPNLKCKILLFDNTFELKVEVESIDMSNTIGSRLGRAIYKDKSTMIFEIKKDKINVKEITNIDDFWNYEGSKCIQTVLKRGTGLVHIGGIRSSKVIKSPFSESAPSAVEIDFTNIVSELSLLQIDCPKEASITEGGYKLGVRAFPMYVRFMAKEGNQVIYAEGSRGSEHFLQISVRKMTEEDNSTQ